MKKQKKRDNTMIGKIKWKKKNGNEIETNDLKATVEYMESLGAARVDDLMNLPTEESKDVPPENKTSKKTKKQKIINLTKDPDSLADKSASVAVGFDANAAGFIADIEIEAESSGEE